MYKNYLLNGIVKAILFLKQLIWEEKMDKPGKNALILMVGLILILAGTALAELELKFNSTLWFRYTIIPDNDENYFSVDRLYLGARFKLSDRIQGKFLTNIFQDFKPQIVYNDMEDPIGLTLPYNDGWAVRIEDAYVNIKCCPYANVRTGVQELVFGTSDLWKYPTIQQTLERWIQVPYKTKTGKKATLIERSDLGISVWGECPEGYASYAVATIQGTGYTNPEDNKAKDVIGSITVNPLAKNEFWKGLSFRVSYYWGKELKDELDKSRLAAVVRFKHKIVDLIGEYLSSTDDKVDGVGGMAFAGIRIFKPLELVLRYDRWDPDVDKEKNAMQKLIGGVNWFIEETENYKVMAQFNVENTNYENEAVDDENLYIFQLRWEF